MCIFVQHHIFDSRARLFRQAQTERDLPFCRHASPSPHAEILEHVKPLLAEHNVELDIVEFDDYVMPNTGVEDGSLDANYFQHQPYLNDFNAEQSTHIVSVATVHYEPMGIYPGKTASLDVFGK